MKLIWLAIVIGAVFLAALPVTAADHEAENAKVREVWLRHAKQCQMIVIDMESKGMKGDWFLMPCLRDALDRS